MALKLAAAASLLVILREMHEKIFIKFARYVGFDKSVTFWGSCVYHLTHWYRIFPGLVCIRYISENTSEFLGNFQVWSDMAQRNNLLNWFTPDCTVSRSSIWSQQGLALSDSFPLHLCLLFFSWQSHTHFTLKKMSMVVFLLLSTFTFVLVLSFSNTSIPIYVILTVIHRAVYICMFQLSSWMCLKIVNLFFSV